jgi:hypothetical protein
LTSDENDRVQDQVTYIDARISTYISSGECSAFRICHSNCECGDFLSNADHPMLRSPRQDDTSSMISESTLHLMPGGREALRDSLRGVVLLPST